MAQYHLRGPLTDADIAPLRIGDSVTVSGSAFTCRSRLQRYIFDEGHTLPFSTRERGILIHAGPVVIREDGRRKLVSFMPTSSIRFEKWGARSVEDWGLKLIVGKTTMGAGTAQMMRQKTCVHVSPQSVSPNLWIDSIRIEDVRLFDELGSIEAPWLLTLDRLGPFIVDIDSTGQSLFEQLDGVVETRRKKALQALGVPEDFSYTKLY